MRYRDLRLERAPIAGGMSPAAKHKTQRDAHADADTDTDTAVERTEIERGTPPVLKKRRTHHTTRLRRTHRHAQAVRVAPVKEHHISKPTKTDTSKKRGWV